VDPGGAQLHEREACEKGAYEWAHEGNSAEYTSQDAGGDGDEDVNAQTAEVGLPTANGVDQAIGAAQARCATYPVSTTSKRSATRLLLTDADAYIGVEEDANGVAALSSLPVSGSSAVASGSYAGGFGFSMIARVGYNLFKV
jgi:hypothetical protein